ncbi:hypothetical protein N8T08_007675 [Aspergillus melleus]|uniref:Uncharacterized protein n=1 Tax=Aspergillus melleus TaxID=138277 RepID=A0ACC3BE89_9EURO|nr:hypothetical protein N8T08_007675 [Aspergillus melleus]
MECSAFLSKWFEVIADTHDREPLFPLEYRVIRWVMRVVREALLSHDDMIHLGYQITDYDLTQLSETARLLSYAVVKLDLSGKASTDTLG